MTHYELRRDGTLLATFAQVGQRGKRRNGSDMLTVSCSMDADVDPAVEHLWVDGRAVTWRDDRLEVWAWRDEQVKWQGPVVAVEPDWVAGTMLVRARTREAHLERLVNGAQQPRTLLFDDGIFDSSLTGWTGYGGSSASATDTITYRGNDYSMSLADGLGGYQEAWLYLASGTYRNTVHFAVAAYPGFGHWPDWGKGDGQLVAVVTHFWPGPEEHESYPLIIPSDAAGDQWHRASVALPQSAGTANSYRIRIYNPDGASALVGELLAARNDNVSSRTGWQVSTFAAATFDAALTDLNQWGGATWDRSVDVSTETFYAAKVEPKIDLGDYSSFLDDIAFAGEWWVDGYTLRWAPTRAGHVESWRIDLDTCNVTSTHDATGSATAAVVYANGDGVTGPLRDEGRAEAIEAGAVLHTVLRAWPGADPQDLDQIAEAHLESPEALVDESIDVTPTAGVDGGPVGDLQDVLVPGCTVDVVLDRGSCSFEAVARVDRVTVDDLEETVALEVTVVEVVGS